MTSEQHSAVTELYLKMLHECVRLRETGQVEEHEKLRQQSVGVFKALQAIDCATFDPSKRQTVPIIKDDE